MMLWLADLVTWTANNRVSSTPGRPAERLLDKCNYRERIMFASLTSAVIAMRRHKKKQTFRCYQDSNDYTGVMILSTFADYPLKHDTAEIISECTIKERTEGLYIQHSNGHAGITTYEMASSALFLRLWPLMPDPRRYRITEWLNSYSASHGNWCTRWNMDSRGETWTTFPLAKSYGQAGQTNCSNAGRR